MKRTALAVLAALTLASCSLLPGSPDDETSPAPATATPDTTEGPVVSGPPSDPLSSPVYDQEVVWEKCGSLECATIQVPVDWSMPDGATISLALNRRPADDQANKVGSLLLNPGGPGGSGLELVEYFEEGAGERLLDSYDLIGFDPRGVGESSPIDCGDGATVSAYYIPDFSVVDEATQEQARTINEAFAKNCRELSGRLLLNVDTASAARDMDVIRALVGDEKLNYLGFSYGTQLGATYAELYPEHVGRMVLDGAVDFLLDGTEQAKAQAQGFESALSAFIDWCLPRETCPLTGPAENARQQIAQIALNARDQGYGGYGATPVNGNLMVYGIVVTLYDEGSWEYLEEALAEVLSTGDAPFFGVLADFYLDRDSDSGEYLSNSTVAFTAINCLDAGEPWTVQEQLDFAAMMQEASPTFGWWFASGTGCEGWPYTADETVDSLDNAASAAPMLVIGTTNDPATPYAWAVSLAEQVGGTLLTYEGEGHTAYGRSNQCIIDAVDGFLVDGVMPAEGTRC